MIGKVLKPEYQALHIKPGGGGDKLLPRSLMLKILAWWHTYVIPVLWRLRQENFKVEASLGYKMGSKPAWIT
jgi:hypothetical protein